MQPRYLLAALSIAGLAILAPNLATAETQYFRLIDKSQAKLVFLVPGLGPSASRYERSFENGNIRQELLQWRGKRSRIHTAVILEEFVGAYVYTGRADIIEQTKNWHFWKRREIRTLDSGATASKLGQVEYRIVQSESLSCVIFLAYFGDAADHDGRITGTAFVNGYHCPEDSALLTKDFAARVIVQLGVKGYGVPNSAAD